ncbi:hypothetical protein GCM10022631_25530 [Deinococcus rubellus]
MFGAWAFVHDKGPARSLNQYDWNRAACWALLKTAQWEFLRLAAYRKRRPTLRVSVNLTKRREKGQHTVLAQTASFRIRHGAARDC